MSERIPTPKPESKKPSYNDEVDIALDIARQGNLGPAEADAARRLVAAETSSSAPRRVTPPEDTPYDKGYRDGHYDGRQEGQAMGRIRGRRAGVVGTLVAGAAVVGGVHLLGEALDDSVEFSPETTTFVAEAGDGVWDAAEQVIGSEKLNNLHVVVDHIAQDPANIDVLKDGLQQGESLVIPVEVKES